MKNLYLLRHGKSSWDNPDLKDFERPLNSRGLADVPIMAKRFCARNSTLDCIVCSPATRTKSTAKIFAETIGYTGEGVVSNPELYFAGVGMFLKAATVMDAAFESAMLVGHNPAITEFVNAMTGSDIDNIPTSGLVHLSLDIDNWEDVVLGEATLVDFDYPKRTSST
ncbi:MAG: histidine phosphatase family protein [Pseudohongiellaceae bacterium]